MPIVDNAVYVDGRRIRDPDSLEQTFEHMRENHGMAWIGLLRPTEHEILAVAEEFSLHPLAVEDALKGHQRAKLERYGDTLFVVLRPARYLDDTETVEFGELHLFIGPDFVVTIRHADVPDLSRVRARIEGHPDVLRQGSKAVLHAILDEVVDQYTPVTLGLQNDVDEIEDALFDTGSPQLSRRIYTLSREVIHFQRAADPLAELLESLLGESEKHGVDIEVQRLLRDVLDHALRISDKLGALRAILDNALTLNATLVTQRQTDTALEQNEQVKKISGWAAILFGPTLVGTIYGMNFTHMPELEWTFGYPLAVLAMAGTSVALWAVFKAKRWL